MNLKKAIIQLGIIFSINVFLLRYIATTPELVKNSEELFNGINQREVDTFLPKNNKTVKWCILDENNTFAFVHVPHAAEVLLQCWSWFQTFNRTEECGFYLRGKLSLEGKTNLMGEWKKTLVHAMGCQVTTNKPPIEHPSYYLIRKSGESRWLWKKEDMHSLRGKLDDFGLVNEGYTSGSLRIGFVNRQHNRRILNMDNITSMARQMYSEATITIANMEDLTGIEQMRWWSSQDIVVAAHGAALTNMIFLHENSAIVEVFPAHYCPIHYFGSLCNVTGVRNYRYYSNCTTTAAMNKNRVHLRSLDLEPRIDEVMNLMSKAVEGFNSS